MWESSRSGRVFWIDKTSVNMFALLFRNSGAYLFMAVNF